ncbi:MAG: nucleotide exchange factor GrpE [Verrucomicrobiota bacterium]
MTEMTDQAETQPAAERAPAAAPEAEAVALAAPLVKAEWTPEQLEDLKARASRADENYDRFLRVTADFDNFRKRAARERQEAIRFANESILAKLVPVLDNFDMALTAATNAPSSNAESFRAGVAMIYNQLKSALAEAGLEEIDATQKPFDPNWHEAVSEQESAAAEGQVLQQLRKGYKLSERLIRPATVVVAKKPGGAA